MQRKHKIHCLTLFLLLTNLFLFSLNTSNANDIINVFFYPISNASPDKPINFYPQNMSTNISITVTLEVIVYDNSSDLLDVYFYNASDDSLIGIDYDVSTNGLNAGIASFIWSDLENNITYRWYTISNDGEYNNTSDIWNFKTSLGGAPVIENNICPTNNSIDADLQINCNIQISDNDGHEMDVYWYENTSGNWVLKQTNLSISNGTYYWTFLNAINYSTKYYWKVVINDDFYQISEIYNFITKTNPYDESSSENNFEFIYPPNQNPIAKIIAPDISFVNLTLVFYANQSIDPDGHIIGYRWDFNNDGIFDTDWIKESFVEYYFNKPGNYTIKLIVRDGRGAESFFYHNMSIIGDQQAQIVKINRPYYSSINENIFFNCTFIFEIDTESIEYLWEFGDGQTSNIKNPNHSYISAGNYTVILKIIDNDKIIDTTQTYVIIEYNKQNKVKELPLLLSIFILMAVLSLIIVIIIIKKKLFVK